LTLTETPQWVLLFSFWLHMLATVVWIGGLASAALFVLPAARKLLPVDDYARFVTKFNQKLNPLGWLSAGVLVATGLVQMGANPSYEGFLNFGNDWAQAMLIKHLLFGGMILVSGYLTWGLAPALERLAIAQLRSPNPEEEMRLRQVESRLLYLNLLLGILVLVLTAMARIA